ncbi:Putative ammonium transporter, marine subtype [Kangiella sediminilitoris]|uniref:Ammonium transporter n=2 Tax=Kangiella sediminilitoris TaxID=1144748 RepID=A0A1B3BBU6_9GAMM|nr:Putative ammonium transporter, marine subtype [Kangiella sediminilitoris]
MQSDLPIFELSYALNTFYVLSFAILVMWMAAGFTMLEAGLVRAKNTVEILTKNIALYSIASLSYLLIGYQIMYPDAAVNSWFPGFSFPSYTDLSAEEAMTEGASISTVGGIFFQLVFVATAMSIVSGAVAERMKLWAFLIFCFFMTALIYPIQGYWKWGLGFLETAGFYDFAGSGVVHLCGAVAAFAGVLLLGPRKGKYGPGNVIKAFPGANIPLATLGTLILWMGWFGFNGGSLLEMSNVNKANTVALILLNTNTAAAAGGVGALIFSKIRYGRADLTMILNGVLGGLVTITADPVSPTPLIALVYGLIAGVLIMVSIVTFDRLKIDDPVGAISVHGVGGILGLLVVPLTNGKSELISQLLGVGVITLWTFLASFAVWLVIKKTLGIRINDEYEYEGADQEECGLEAYPEFTKS